MSASSLSPVSVHQRVCPLCEATCGLEIRTRGREVLSIRGDDADVLSRGYLCPKAIALQDLDADPDRLRQPQIRRDGRHVPVSWDEAYEEIERRLVPILERHGPEAVATYAGNPTVHNTDLMLYLAAFNAVFPGKNRYSAATADQMPKHVSCGLMFGGFLSIPVPDIDRTGYLLVIGANPLASNGSLFTVPDFRGRAKALRTRGGRLVVVDPRRSETAEIADRHLFIRPGTDASFLMGLVFTLFDEGLAKLGDLERHVAGLEEVRTAARDFAPERVARHCGIAAEEIRELARELAGAPSAAVYGRIGTCTQAFGTLASWAIDVLNVLTGNLDRPGGVMFPLAPAFAENARGDGSGVGSGVRLYRRKSRVRGAPEVMGQYPCACLAEEIETPGEGQIRALITIAGNPALSTPNSDRLARALASLEFMVSLDLYLNETTRHADVILPGSSPLENAHFDVAFSQLQIRNCARYSLPVFEGAPGPREWETLLRLAGILMGRGAHADVQELDDLGIRLQVQAACSRKGSGLHARDPEEILAALAGRRGPDRILDFALRSGPYGDAFGARSEGPCLSLDKLLEHPHGIDLGPLAPRLPGILSTPSGKLELAPEPMLHDLERLRAALDGSRVDDGSLLLIGRRQVRDNNSWMHNLPVLAKGPFRCTMQIHPTDAARLGLLDRGRARVRSRVGSVEVTLEVSEAIMPGVVSIPHGWGHDQAGTSLRVAAERPGVNSNRLADEAVVEPLSGNAVFNGIPVSVEAP